MGRSNDGERGHRPDGEVVGSDRADIDDRGAIVLAELRRVGTDAGLAAVGATTAEVLEPARSVLGRRKAEGLAGTMQFTYRNPERSTDPRRILADARSLVVGVYDYGPVGPPPEPRESAPVGRVGRYAWQDHYERLRVGLRAISDVVTAAGHAARIVADSNDLVDRNAAWRAGLGWYGKNTNLLVEGRGSWVVLGAVVTDAVVRPDRLPVVDGCGSCAQCLDACPTGALVGPGVLDARRCLAWLVQAGEPIPVEHRPAVGHWLYGCDICQDVCPPNRVTDRRSEPTESDPRSMAWLDLAWALTASDRELLDRCGRWYIADRDPDVIRRTALVVLGNVGAVGDRSVASLLSPYLSSPNSMLRAHATWAARRLGLSEAEQTRDDPAPEVRAEWSDDVTPRPTR